MTPGAGEGDAVARPRSRFQARDRLRRRSEFDRVFADGVRAGGPCLTVVGAANELGHGRLGIAVGRRVGNAVARNRIKRRIREAFRRDGAARRAGADFVVLPRASVASIGFADLEKELRRAMAQVVRKVARC